MRALLQRVSSAHVTIGGGGDAGGEVTGSIQRGLLVLAGIHKLDTPADGEWIIKKILSMRIFEDDAGKMGRSIEDIRGEILVVSQFTLYGNLRKGTRPDFSDSMPGPQAREFYDAWMKRLRESTALRIQEGRFAAPMNVHLVNDGPVTIMIESKGGETPPGLPS